MKLIGIRTLKTALGAVLAIFIAQQIGLLYATSAGIITILSIQNTKRESFLIAFKRLLAALIGIGMSLLLFNLFGFNLIILGLFVLVFIPLTVKFKISDGIVMTAVIITHFYVERNTSIFFIYNELLIIVIGILVALVLNLYMPSVESMVKKNLLEIDIYTKRILEDFVLYLNKSNNVLDYSLLENLDQLLEKAKKNASINLNNTIFSNDYYYIKYFEMRDKQHQALIRMHDYLSKMPINVEQSKLVATFTNEVINQFSTSNDAILLIDKLNKLKDLFKSIDLPKTREEFEARAMLYQYLNDLEKLLEIKRDFIINNIK